MSHSSHNEDHHHHEEEAVESPSSGNTERYEIEDLFQGEAPENQHFIKVAGVVLIAVFLFLSLAYPFTFLLP